MNDEDIQELIRAIRQLESELQWNGGWYKDDGRDLIVHDCDLIVGNFAIRKIKR